MDTIKNFSLEEKTSLLPDIAKLLEVAYIRWQKGTPFIQIEEISAWREMGYMITEEMSKQPLEPSVEKEILELNDDFLRFVYRLFHMGIEDAFKEKIYTNLLVYSVTDELDQLKKLIQIEIVRLMGQVTMKRMNYLIISYLGIDMLEVYRKYLEEHVSLEVYKALYGEIIE